MVTQENNRKHVHYHDGEEPDVEQTIRSLVEEFVERKEAEEKPESLSKKEESYLLQKYKNDEQARSKAQKFMRAFANGVNIDNPEGSIAIASMKEWTKATKKFNLSARNMNDLGRGRIYIDSLDGDIKQYEEAVKFIDANSLNIKGGKPKAQYIIDIKGVEILEGSVDDYIKKTRKSGFAGSINLNLKIDNKKGRTGYFELQIMPKFYKDCDAHSHIIYDMITIFEGIPKRFKNESQKIVDNVLHTANEALFYEHASRTGFINVNEELQDFSIDEETQWRCWDVLDHIRTELENTRYATMKRPPTWYKKSLDAITYAKTSVANTYRWTNGPNSGNEHSL